MDLINRRELLLNQRKDNEFSRLDIVVRNCFLNSINTKDYKFYRDLYKKMQFIRTGHNNHIKGIPWVEEFLLLDKSFYKNGYLDKFPLIVNEQKHLINSSHRAALCLHHKIDEIPILVTQDWKSHLENSGSKTKTYFNYGKSWFEQNNFSDLEMMVVQKKKEDLFKDLNLFFYVILWPPVEDYFDEILKSLQKKYNILEYKKRNLGTKLDTIVKEIYEIDNIEDWKVNKKLENIKLCTKRTNIFIIKIDLFATNFRSKTKHPDVLISIDAELIKKDIREKYRNKVKHYFYDIIVHMSDNYQHVDHIKKVLESCDA